MFRLAGRAIIKRIARAVVTKIVSRKLSPDAFRNAAKATTAHSTEIPPEAYGDVAPCEGVDAANPFWDCSYEADTGSDCTPPADFPTLEC